MVINNRERLIQAGIQLLSEKTFSEISMDQVAESSDVSKPMIYYYFKNKEGYYTALAEHLLRMAFDLMKEFYDPSLSLRENLLLYVRMRVSFIRENPEITSAFMSIINDPNIGTLISGIQEDFEKMRLDFIDPLFDKALERGEISPSVDRGVVMMMVNSFLVAYTVKTINGICFNNDIDPEKIVEILFDGISAQREDC